MSGNRPKSKLKTDKKQTTSRRADRRAPVRRKTPGRSTPPRPKRTDKDGWKGLESHKVRRPRSAPRSIQDPLIQRMATLKMAFMTILALAVVTAYIGHVMYTKELFAEVQEAKTENRTLHLKMNRLRSELESRTSPGTILKRAEELGLQPSRSFGAPIKIDKMP